MARLYFSGDATTEYDWLIGRTSLYSEGLSFSPQHFQVRQRKNFHLKSWKAIGTLSWQYQSRLTNGWIQHMTAWGGCFSNQPFLNAHKISVKEVVEISGIFQGSVTNLKQEHFHPQMSQRHTNLNKIVSPSQVKYFKSHLFFVVPTEFYNIFCANMTSFPVTFIYFFKKIKI